MALANGQLRFRTAVSGCSTMHANVYSHENRVLIPVPFAQTDQRELTTEGQEHTWPNMLLFCFAMLLLFFLFGAAKGCW